ncbi:hypothetical protein CW360_10155 [Pseudomonas fluvialis]|uniref:Phage tail fibre protein N-terminal domain-containing protein n=1 Tax=Pseudomonas fluvialis TaxID=1793966 RepID=A0A2I0CNZ4_9PSED|nr:phage tail protein [Pseudomonas pharmacofabricae]PKF70879.1 hypothetical protein CW360_10155 [Pseudomonas pharmacofabricae]
MALLITITNAGRAEIINAQNTGTEKVTITAVALGTGQYTPSKTQTALQAEVKRVSSIGGQVVAADTIHVMAKDESSAAYNVGEFGLISDKGTLIAIYSQLPAAGWIIQKAAPSTLLLATDIILESLDTSVIEFGDITFTNPPATETTPGVTTLINNLESSSSSAALSAAMGKRLQDEKQAKDATLTALAELVTAANQIIYSTGADQFALATLSAFARTLLDDTDDAEALLTLGAAPLDSPTFTGMPKAPTAPAGTSNTQLATTEFVAAVQALLNEAISLRAPLDSPALTGNATAPTQPLTVSNNLLATTAYVQAAVAALVNSSPAALDTLNELAAALGNDPNFATTVTTALASKQPLNINLNALSSLEGAPNTLPYFTGAGALSLTTITAEGRDLLACDAVSAMGEFLGLVKQSNAFDYTLGRLMLNGAHGLGRRGELIENIAESINEWSTNFKVYNSSTVGAPDSHSGTIINIGFPSGTYGTQIILSLSGEMFFRAGNYVDAQMRKLYHDGNISTATVAKADRLSTARKINGVDFDGSKDIQIAANDPRALGIGQTWKDVTASRLTNTTYTNTTGKPIMIHFIGNAGAAGGLFVDGVRLKFDTLDTESITAIIPIDAQYSIVSTITEQWLELS